MQQNTCISSYPSYSLVYTSQVKINGINYQLASHFTEFKHQHKISVIYSTLQTTKPKPT